MKAFVAAAFAAAVGAPINVDVDVVVVVVVVANDGTDGDVVIQAGKVRPRPRPRPTVLVGMRVVDSLLEGARPGVSVAAGIGVNVRTDANTCDVSAVIQAGIVRPRPRPRPPVVISAQVAR